MGQSAGGGHARKTSKHSRTNGEQTHAHRETQSACFQREHRHSNEVRCYAQHDSHLVTAPTPGWLQTSRGRRSRSNRIPQVTSDMVLSWTLEFGLFAHVFFEGGDTKKRHHKKMRDDLFAITNDIITAIPAGALGALGVLLVSGEHYRIFWVRDSDIWFCVRMASYKTPKHNVLCLGVRQMHPSHFLLFSRRRVQQPCLPHTNRCPCCWPG